MEIKTAKISNHASNPSNPDNSVFEMKGMKGLGCLVEGYNTPKDGENSVESKVNRILVESFMKRPALSAEAMNNIFERANNGLMVSQSPQYPSYASAAAVFFLKNKFVYATAGDNVIFHFVNGRIADVFCTDPGEEPAFLGTPGYAGPKVGDEVAFSKGSHTFLICSKSFADALDEDILEGSLSSNTHITEKGKNKLYDVKCERWLRELKDNIPGYDGNDNYSAIAFTMPERKKSKLMLIIIILAVLLIAAAVFFVFNGPPKQAPKNTNTAPESQSDIEAPPGVDAPQAPQQPDAPSGGGGLFGCGREEPTAPQAPPAPPTRPPLEN